MESTVFIQKSTDIFTPFESAIDIDTSRIPAEKVKLYYIMMIMLHYPEVAAIVEKYQLGDKLHTLIERSNLYDRDRVGSLFIGRVMSKEILQAVAQQNKPYNNTFLYNPRMSTYEVLKLVSQS
ncbi:hypothetical protein KPH14_008572 [Odynerus spinipes]|uniref:Uncharacterized protein n=1 Tax=Odynerus spinipes TaxID=1348599 RepID=A0AAD9RTD3_9HYME|nr:hypothetical protein KPH14_008572 [Odynerus spinipes]